MAVNNTVKVYRVFANAAIDSAGSISHVVDVSALIGSTVGKMAYQYYCASAGAADVDITYTMSLDNVTFFDPTTPAIKEAITPAGTTEAGGAEYDYEFAPFLKITATETGSVAVTRFDLWLAFG